MMQFEVKKQEKFSRGQLLLRTFFGGLYIALPHLFVLFFVGIWAKILWIVNTFQILLTGTYPKKGFDYQLNVSRWLARVHLSIYNLSDGYPAFGLQGDNGNLTLEMTYYEHPDRLKTLLRFLFGTIYILAPHFFILYFRFLICGILYFIAFFAVLFTGKYPDGLFDFQVGTLRWSTRVLMHFLHMDDTYPPFSGK